MNAAELFTKEGKSAGVWFCTGCRIVHHVKDNAESCCAPVICECGATVKEQYYRKCQVCRDAESIARERERFEKAEKLTTWDGPVYCEGVGMHGDFSKDISDFIDAWETDHDETDPLPEYVWACKLIHYAQLDWGSIEEGIYESSLLEEPDAMDIQGVEEFKGAIEHFNDANRNTVSWEPDYKRAVLLAGYAKKEA